MGTWIVILIFGVLVIVFDGIWATITKAKGYPYSKGIWVSFLLYAFAGLTASHNGSIAGIISGAGASLIDATIGWWLSWVIGPGPLPETISKSPSESHNLCDNYSRYHRCFVWLFGCFS